MYMQLHGMREAAGDEASVRVLHVCQVSAFAGVFRQAGHGQGRVTLQKTLRRLQSRPGY